MANKNWALRKMTNEYSIKKSLPTMTIIKRGIAVGLLLGSSMLQATEVNVGQGLAQETNQTKLEKLEQRRENFQKSWQDAKEAGGKKRRRVAQRRWFTSLMDGTENEIRRERKNSNYQKKEELKLVEKLQSMIPDEKLNKYKILENGCLDLSEKIRDLKDEKKTEILLLVSQKTSDLSDGQAEDIPSAPNTPAPAESVLDKEKNLIQKLRSLIPQAELNEREILEDRKLYLCGDLRKIDDEQKTKCLLLVSEMMWLEELHLSYNGLTKIPKELGNLSNLRRLEINVNDLTELPTELKNLSNLRQLVLSQNKLTSVPSEFGESLHLDGLWLYGNKLTSVPSSFKNFRPDIILDLRNNKGFYGYSYRSGTLGREELRQYFVRHWFLPDVFDD